MIEYNSAPEGVRLIHDEDGVSNALLGEELGHVGHEAEELLEAATEGDDEAELVLELGEIRVGDIYLAPKAIIECSALVVIVPEPVRGS